MKQEISDRALDVGEHGCSVDHTLSERAEGDFHIGSEFGPDTLREQSTPIVQYGNSPVGSEKGVCSACCVIQVESGAVLQSAKWIHRVPNSIKR